jgi:DNA-binding MarR family transcriptional regulator
MKLENEIGQKKFKSDNHKLMVNMIYTTNWMNAKYTGYFENHEITIQQYNVLRILRGQFPTPCNVKLIKERMLDRMSDASRIVDKLFRKNLVERKECPGDRRNVDVLITEKGLQILNELDYVDDSCKDIFKSLTKQEIKTLNNLLDKLRGD